MLNIINGELLWLLALIKVLNFTQRECFCDLSERKSPFHWLKVSLRGTESNRDGLGAVVRVTAGQQVYSQMMDGKSGYLSQSLLPLYFGLGEADTVDAIEVSWPSGKTQRLAEPTGVDRELVIEEQ